MKFPARVLVVGLAVVLVTGTGGFLYLNRAPQPLTESLPATNGFDALVKVENAWRNGPNSAPNAALLADLRSGLAKESRMPLTIAREVFKSPPTQFNKTLIVGLIEMAEKELAAGRNREAVELWNDALRFGPARVRGGLLIHRMVGMAGEKRVVESIESNLDRLQPAERKVLAATLRQLESQWEPATEVFARDLSVGLEQTPPNQRFGARLAVVFTGSMKKVETKVTQNLQAASARRTQLADDLER